MIYGVCSTNFTNNQNYTKTNKLIRCYQNWGFHRITRISNERKITGSLFGVTCQIFSKTQFLAQNSPQIGSIQRNCQIINFCHLQVSQKPFSIWNFDRKQSFWKLLKGSSKWPFSGKLWKSYLALAPGYLKSLRINPDNYSLSFDFENDQNNSRD